MDIRQFLFIEKSLATLSRFLFLCLPLIEADLLFGLIRRVHINPATVVTTSDLVLNPSPRRLRTSNPSFPPFFWRMGLGDEDNSECKIKYCQLNNSNHELDNCAVTAGPLSLRISDSSFVARMNIVSNNFSVVSKLHRIHVTGQHDKQMISPQPNQHLLILNDMLGQHEAKLSGVPDEYSWAIGPRIGMGNNPGAWNAMTAWGQIYKVADSSLPPNTRVEIKDLRAYQLSKASQQWHLLQSPGEIEGSAFREDYLDNLNVSPDLRHESEKSISVRLAPGFNFHFWPASGRVPINPNDIGGMYVTFQARLVSHDPYLPDDRSQARILAGAGGDYWLSIANPWDGMTNADFAIGKMKLLTTDWQFFSAHTLSCEMLVLSPPPLE